MLIMRNVPDVENVQKHVQERLLNNLAFILKKFEEERLDPGLPGSGLYL